MDDKNQKERLEQELRFLKESFEAEVISKEEFEKGKDRIEKKLKEIKGIERKQDEEIIIEQIEVPPKPEEPKEEAMQKEPEKIKLKVINDEVEEPQYFEPAQKTEQKTAPEKLAFEEPKKESKFFKYAVIFVVLVLVVFFSYSLLKSMPAKNLANKKIFQELQSTKISKTNVVVLNDRNCFNCGTQRVLSILENWFGTINAKEVDYNTLEGKNLADKLDARILPTYVFDGNISKNPQFEKFKAVFIKKNDNYVLSDDAAGSTFYLKRDNIPNKLDFFLIEGDDASIKAEKNLKEFLDAFPEVKFEKHLSTDKLSQELAIKAYPTFLINNIDKFNGAQSAETIKENFCKLNKLMECEKSLSKSLV